MGTKRSYEFRADAVRIALPSGLTRKQVGSDLGVGLSTLNKWIPGLAGVAYRHARTPGRGSLRSPARSPETRRCARPNTSAAPSGASGADTTAEAAPRRNFPGHFLRKYPAGQWMHCVKLLGQSLMARDFDRQIARSPNSRSAPPC